MKTLGRLLGAVVLAFAASTFTFILLGLLLTPLQRFDSQPVVFHGLRVLLCACEGFAFVFAGSLTMPRKWRGTTAFGLLVIGVAFFIQVNGGESTGSLPVWHLVASVTGGLLAILIERLTRHANTEPSGCRQGRDSASVDNRTSQARPA